MPYKSWHYIIDINDNKAHIFWCDGITEINDYKTSTLCKEVLSRPKLPTSYSVGFGDLEHHILCFNCYNQMTKVNNPEVKLN